MNISTLEANNQKINIETWDMLFLQQGSVEFDNDNIL